MPEIGSLPQQLENTDQTYSELATINRRLNLLEVVDDYKKFGLSKKTKILFHYL